MYASVSRCLVTQAVRSVSVNIRHFQGRWRRRFLLSPPPLPQSGRSALIEPINQWPDFTLGGKERGGGGGGRSTVAPADETRLRDALTDGLCKKKQQPIRQIRLHVEG